MSASQFALLVFYAVGMALGQVLFKSAAISMQASQAQSAAGWLLRLAVNPYLIAAAIVYLALSALWVWILTFTPLSRAYPFVAVAFVVTPLAGQFLFSEPVGNTFYLGMALVAVGLLLVIR